MKHSVKIAMVAAACMVGTQLMSGCGSSRSVDAYCSSMEKHKDRYLSAMGSAQQSMGKGGLGAIGGLLGSASAIADLKTMWAEMASAAPNEIQAETERVRDAWDELSDNAAKAADSPLKGLGSSIATGVKMYQPSQRIDSYVKKNCKVKSGSVSETSNSSASPTTTTFPPVDQSWNVEWNGVSDSGKYAIFNDGQYLQSSQEETGTAVIGNIETGLIVRPAHPRSSIWGSPAYNVFDDATGTPSLHSVHLAEIPATGLSPRRYEYVSRVLDIHTGEERSSHAITDLVFERHDNGDVDMSSISHIGSRKGVHVFQKRQGQRTSIVAVEAVTGLRKWEQEVSRLSDGSTANFDSHVRGGIVIVNTRGNCRLMAGFDLMSGQLVWDTSTLSVAGTPCGGGPEDNSFKENGLLFIHNDYKAIHEVQVPFLVETGKVASVDLSASYGSLGPSAQAEPVFAVSKTLPSQSVFTNKPSWQFIEKSTGKVLSQIPEDRVAQLDARMLFLWKSLAWIKTTDATIVVDTKTGSVVSKRAPFVPLVAGEGGAVVKWSYPDARVAPLSADKLLSSLKELSKV